MWLTSGWWKHCKFGKKKLRDEMELRFKLVYNHVFNDMKRNQVSTKHGIYDLTTAKIWSMDRKRRVKPVCFDQKWKKCFDSWLRPNLYHWTFTNKGEPIKRWNARGKSVKLLRWSEKEKHIFMFIASELHVNDVHQARGKH